MMHCCERFKGGKCKKKKSLKKKMENYKSERLDGFPEKLISRMLETINRRVLTSIKTINV